MKNRLVVALSVGLAAGNVLFAGGEGRTEVVKLPPAFMIETVAECDGFNVLESFQFEVKVLVQRDQFGNVVKVLQHLSTGGRTTYYNSNQTEIVFVGGPEQLTFKADYIHGRITLSGVNYKITVPGGGMLLHQGGHYVLDVLTNEWTHVGGPDDFYSGDIAALCEALTP